jgi:hypothetical protein
LNGSPYRNNHKYQKEKRVGRFRFFSSSSSSSSIIDSKSHNAHPTRKRDRIKHL